MLRVWHPSLTGVEREALQYLFDVCGDQKLAMTDEGLFRYDQLAKGRDEYFKGLLDSLDALIAMDTAAAKAEADAAEAAAEAEARGNPDAEAK